MGDVIDINDARRIKVVDFGSLGLTVQYDSVEIQGYSFYSCACTLLDMLSRGAVIVPSKIVLRVIPRPDAPPRPPPVLLVSNQSEPTFSLWSWCRRLFLGKPKVVKLRPP